MKPLAYAVAVGRCLERLHADPFLSPAEGRIVAQGRIAGAPPLGTATRIVKFRTGKLPVTLPQSRPAAPAPPVRPTTGAGHVLTE